MDMSDAETIAALARNRVAGSLERNGLAENGFDLMKGIGIGFVLGRVSFRKILPTVYTLILVSSCTFGPWSSCWSNSRFLFSASRNETDYQQHHRKADQKRMNTTFYYRTLPNFIFMISL